jgi:hypothetical protein
MKQGVMVEENLFYYPMFNVKQIKVWYLGMAHPKDRVLLCGRVTWERGRVLLTRQVRRRRLSSRDRSTTTTRYIRQAGKASIHSDGARTGVAKRCSRPLHTVLRSLWMGICSEKCVVRRFGRCVNATECTYTNPDSTAYDTPSLYGIAYCS